MTIIQFSRLLILTIASSLVGTGMSLHAHTLQKKPTSVQKELSKLESYSGGRIGIYAINTADNSLIQYRSQERFSFQSTFKVIGVSAILKQSMTDNNFLQQKVTYKKQDLVSWSPITERHLTDGMTIAELCAATIMFSDNTAINLLMKKLGGPAAVTAFSRSIGDHTFNLNNWEPKLNSIPNDFRDSSTPAAMGKSLRQLTLGKILAPSQRSQLLTWMKNNTTGNARIRAGVPKEWIVADKTGSGDYGITNDIGIIWPPKHAPIVVVIYFSQNQKNTTCREDVIASATRILIHDLIRPGKNQTKE